MNIQEEVQVIKKATMILKNRKKNKSTTPILTELLSKAANKESEEKELNKVIDELVKEAYLLGSKGRPCPVCNGSGRM